MNRLLALLSFFPVVADLISLPETPEPTPSSGGDPMTWVMLALLVICIGVSVWVFVSSKKKKR